MLTPESPDLYTLAMPMPTILPNASLVPCNPQRILVVDDDEEIREVFTLVLSEAFPDCNIEVAVNGADAFEQFQKNRHAILIVDLHMPVMDGEEAFHEITELCGEEDWQMPTVIFCTAYNPPRGVQNIVAGNQPHELLRKPVLNEILIATIKKKLNT